MRGVSKKRLREWEGTIEQKARRKRSLNYMRMLNECQHVSETIHSMDDDFMPVHPETGETYFEIMTKFIAANNPNFKLLQGE